MIIKPNVTRVESLYSSLKKNASNVSKACVPYFALICPGLILLLYFMTQIIDGSRKMDLQDAFTAIPICALVGAVIGFIAKPFVKNLLTKGSVSLITEIKNTGIKIDNELVAGRMMKMDEAVANLSLIHI